MRGDRLEEVERSLRDAGHELEPGLDRISGAWADRTAGVSHEAEHAWRAAAEQPPPPSGERVSTLGEAPAPAPEWGSGDAGLDDLDEPEDDDPLELLRWAIEHDQDVEIVYAGARGMTVRRVTPIELDASRLDAWCHLRDDARSFWLRSIREVQPVE